MNELSRAPEPEKAAEACRRLIGAYRHTDHVDWSDVDAALALALDAFGLDESFIEDADDDGEDEA